MCHESTLRLYSTENKSTDERKVPFMRQIKSDGVNPQQRGCFRNVTVYSGHFNKRWQAVPDCIDM